MSDIVVTLGIQGPTGATGATGATGPQGYRSADLVVTSLSDLPTPVANAITLPANTLVVLSGFINLGANYLVMSEGTMIRGLNPGQDGILTTAAVGISATNIGSNVILREFVISTPAGTGIVASDSGDTYQFNGFFIGFLGCQQAMSISGFRVQSIKDGFVSALGATPSQGGFLFGGTTSKTFVSTSVFDIMTGKAIEFGPTYVGQVVDIASNFYKYDTGVGITLDASAYVGGAMVHSNLIDGNLTPLAGVDPSVIPWIFLGNDGIRDSRHAGSIYHQGVDVVTTFAGASTPTKVAMGTAASALNERFSMPTDNRLQLTAIRARLVNVFASFAVTAATNNQELRFYIAKDGVPVTESGSTVRVSTGNDQRTGICNALLELDPGSYVELWVENNTSGASATVRDLVMTVIG